MQILKHWRFKYLTVLFLSLIAAGFLAESDSAYKFFLQVGDYGYMGAFITGVLFVSSFTVATSTVLIALLSESVHPLTIGLIGGLGAVIGDLIIFRFIKDDLAKELSLVFGKYGTSYVKHILKSRYVAWTLPIIGVFILASPLPDELGVGLLGFSKMKGLHFAIVCYLSNAIGIIMIASVAKIL